MLSQAQRSQLNNARTVGGGPSVYLKDSELLVLLGIICDDLGISLPPSLDWKPAASLISEPFYGIPIANIRNADFWPDIFQAAAVETVISEMIAVEPDTFTYFIALTNLHAQRCKYQAILESQPIPELETIIPRGLLEMGGLPADALASWLVWRKFIYDIDNRSAQTAGYLFEPILTLALGGASYGARASPVKRGGTKGGRQVDCIVGLDAYEFKMRVTIAASGQGRFAEELSFAEDCQLSGYRPVLLILDPTPSVKQSDLSARYRNFGGEAYVGDAAWLHLEERAGKVMSQFIERYVRRPVSELDSSFAELMPMSLESGPGNSVSIRIGKLLFQLR